MRSFTSNSKTFYRWRLLATQFAINTNITQKQLRIKTFFFFFLRWVQIVQFFHRASPSINHFVVAESLCIFKVSVVAVPFSRLHSSFSLEKDSSLDLSSLSWPHAQHHTATYQYPFLSIGVEPQHTNRIIHFHTELAFPVYNRIQTVKHAFV